MLFRNRTFRIILFSDIAQQLAIWIRNMALLYYVMERTHGDKIAVSLLSILEIAPIFVFSMVGGVLADRWRPKRTMIAGDLLSAASVGVIMLLLAAGWWEALYVAVFVSAVVSQFSQPASAKVFKRHIPEEHVPAAIGITQSIMSLFLILGPIAGTLIYQWVGLTASLAMLPVLFLLSAAILARLPKDDARHSRERTSLAEDVATGYRFVKSESALSRLFLTFAIVGLAGGLVQPLEIFIVTERLELPKENVQWFAAADGVGLLAGAVLAASLVRLLAYRWLLPASLAFLGVTFAVEAASVWPLLTGSFRFANGVLMGIFNTAVGSYVIARIPDNMVGKVNGMMAPLFMGAMLLGTAASGLLADAVGLLPVYFAASAICIVSMLPSLPVRLAAESAKGADTQRASEG